MSPAVVDRPSFSGRPAAADELLESSWGQRGRLVRGRELRVELAVTAAWLVAFSLLVGLSPPAEAPHPVAALVVAAYALAARVEFPVGVSYVVPTQLFLVPLFALSPAQLVPGLVLAGLLLSALGGVARGRTRADRLVFCAGDAVHALGPALVFTVLVGGDATVASAGVVLLAFLAQLVFDLVSSSVHDVLVLRARPRAQVQVIAQCWSVDAALLPLGLAAAWAAEALPWAALAPLPFVVLLGALAADRSDRVASAHDRLRELERARARFHLAVERVGDAFASRLDLDALLDVLTRAAAEALDAGAARAYAADATGGEPAPRLTVDAGPGTAEALDRAAALARRSGRVEQVAHAGVHALAGSVGAPPEPVALVAVARAKAFADDERSLLGHLCRQAAVSVDNATHHELLREAQARLRHQALHDGLTGLANRILFADRVDHALRRRARHGGSLAVLFVDLDGFKHVNDTLGHDAGDAVLRAAGTRIVACLREGDTAARLGGDEFAVLLEQVAGAGQAEAVAERVRQELSAPVALDGRHVVARASLGLALAGPGIERDELMRCADLAMYAAKGAGGDRVERFRSQMLTRATSRTELARDLGEAARRGQFELRYQPVVDLEAGTVRAVEALARWRHPSRGLLQPRDFIALAEETGTIDHLGRVVLDEACRMAAAWTGGPEGPSSVSVNVSAAQLRDARFPAEVAAALRRHALAPERLVLELTESAVTRSDLGTQTTLDALRALGVTLALDDFGTGWSSLSHLGRLHVGLVKLDRALLAGVDQDDQQARLAGGVLQLARSLDVPVVAEGIERDAQLDRLRELGGTLGQGFLLGAPVDAEALSGRLRAEERARAGTAVGGAGFEPA